jgi:hypothetical protein
LPGPLTGGGRPGFALAEELVLGSNFKTTSHNKSIVIYRLKPELAVILTTAHSENIHVLAGNSNTADYFGTEFYQVKT